MKIESMIARTHDSSYGGYPYKIEVQVSIDSKEFKALKNGIGPIVIFVNNEVYRFNEKIPAYNPSVGGLELRCKKGVKTLRFTYYLQDHEVAISLGFETKRLKNGEFIAPFSQSLNLKGVA